MEAELKLVPAKCGCDGCYYADKDDCPGDADNKLAACSVEGRQMIFVNPSEDGDKEQNDE